MVRTMNEVIDKLKEIESTAVRIMENTNAEKLRIAQESEARITEYERKLQDQVDAKITWMKQENDQEIQQEMQRMQEEYVHDIQRLEEEYQECHTRMAQGIVNILTGV